MDIVIQELKSLSIPMVDLTGFDRRLIIETDDKDDDVPEIPENPKTKPGDVYELGPHRLECADSTNSSSYARLMLGQKADMVFTDPPYNVNYKGQGEKTSEGIMNDKMDVSKFREFLSAVFSCMKDAVKGGGGLYVFHSSSSQAVFEEAMTASGLEIKNQLIWNKPMAALGWGDYRWKHEPFFYAGFKGTAPNFYGDRTHGTVIDFQKTDNQLANWAKRQKQAEKEGRTTIWSMKRERVKDYVHPTQKPVELVMYAIQNSSKVGDIVLDPFLGSGSTLIAAEKTSRICYGLELDPKFADVIVERYVQFTGNREIVKNGEKITW
jgi:DNA modification methylase